MTTTCIKNCVGGLSEHLYAGSRRANVRSESWYWGTASQPHVEIYSCYDVVRWQFSEWIWGNMSSHCCLLFGLLLQYSIMLSFWQQLCLLHCFWELN